MSAERTNELRNRLAGELIGLARATEGNDHLVSESTDRVMLDGLCALGDASAGALQALLHRVDGEKRRLVPMCYQCAASCGRNNAYNMDELKKASEDARSLKQLLLWGSRAIAASGCREKAACGFLYKALFFIGMDDFGTEALLSVVLEMSQVSRKYPVRPEAIGAERVQLSENIRAALAEKLDLPPGTADAAILAALLGY